MSTDPLATPSYADLLRMDGKVMLVLGAGQGIGRETARGLAQLGARVVCVGRGAEATEAVAREVGGIACLGDATVRADMRRIVDETLETCGRLDGLVDILGEPRLRSLDDVTDEDWEWQFNIGLRHVFLSAQLAFPAIEKSGGGTAVYVSSIASSLASRQQIAYGAAKAGLEQFVRSAAVEYGPRGVRVNAVVPGVIRTPRVLRNFAPDRLAQLNAMYPLRETGLPSDIASAILFMSCGLSRHVTGQCLKVDGGLTSRSPTYDVGRASST